MFKDNLKHWNLKKITNTCFTRDIIQGDIGTGGYWNGGGGGGLSGGLLSWGDIVRGMGGGYCPDTHRDECLVSECWSWREVPFTILNT